MKTKYLLLLFISIFILASFSAFAVDTRGGNIEIKPPKHARYNKEIVLGNPGHVRNVTMDIYADNISDKINNTDYLYYDNGIIRISPEFEVYNLTIKVPRNNTSPIETRPILYHCEDKFFNDVLQKCVGRGWQPIDVNYTITEDYYIFYLDSLNSTYTVGPGQTYNNLTACLDAINNTNNTCNLVTSNYIYTIDANRTYYITGFPYTITITADNITLEGNGSMIYGNGSYNGILTSANNIEIRNIKIKNYSDCTYISGGNNITLRNNYFENCVVFVNVPKNDKIVNNIINNSNLHGIFISRGYNNTLINNSIYNATYRGIYISGGNRTTIINNTINKTGWGGIEFGYNNASDINIIGNTLINTYGGIKFYDGYFNNLINITKNIFYDIVGYNVYIGNITYNASIWNNMLLSGSGIYDKDYQPPYEFYTSYSPMYYNGEYFNDSYIFVIPGASIEIITYENQTVSSAYSASNYDLILFNDSINLIGFGAGKLITMFCKDCSSVGITNCQIFESAIGLNPGDCKYFKQNAFVYMGYNYDYLWNDTFNSTYYVIPGYTSPPYLKYKKSVISYNGTNSYCVNNIGNWYDESMPPLYGIDCGLVTITTVNPLQNTLTISFTPQDSIIQPVYYDIYIENLDSSNSYLLATTKQTSYSLNTIIIKNKEGKTVLNDTYRIKIVPWILSDVEPDVVLHSFDNTNNIVVYNDAITPSVNISNYKEGSGSIDIGLNISKSTNDFGWYDISVPLTNVSGNHLHFWFYIKDLSTLQKISDKYGKSLAILITSDNWVNYRRYEILSQDLQVGWNFISIDLDTPYQEVGTVTQFNTVRIEIEENQNPQNVPLGDLKLDYLYISSSRYSATNVYSDPFVFVTAPVSYGIGSKCLLELSTNNITINKGETKTVEIENKGSVSYYIDYEINNTDKPSAYDFLSIKIPKSIKSYSKENITISAFYQDDYERETILRIKNNGCNYDLLIRIPPKIYAVGVAGDIIKETLINNYPYLILLILLIILIYIAIKRR